MTTSQTTTAPAPYVPEHLELWSKDGPTPFDDAANYAGADLSGFYLAPVSVNRDTSDPLTLSNWAVITDELEKLTQHQESGIHRFGHWGCGWYELFLIHALDAAALKAADDWAAALADYPVADEAAWAEAEHEAETEAWESWGASDWKDAVTKRLEELAVPPDDADCYWVDDVMDAVSDEKLAELWADVSSTLNWNVEHLSDGPRFNFEAGAQSLALADLADLTGLALLPEGQQWRREPYPWQGAAPSPLVP